MTDEEDTDEEPEDPDVMVDIVARRIPPGLVGLHLNFGDTDVSNLGLRTIMSNLPPDLAELSLKFYNTAVEDSGAEALAGNIPTALTQLHLDFAGCYISDVGGEALLSRIPSGVTQLHLDFAETEVSNATLKRAGKLVQSELKDLKELRHWRSLAVPVCRRVYLVK